MQELNSNRHNSRRDKKRSSKTYQDSSTLYQTDKNLTALELKLTYNKSKEHIEIIMWMKQPKTIYCHNCPKRYNISGKEI